MIKLTEHLSIKSFEYFYMLIMVIYMGEMTPALGKMRGGLSTNIIELLIPIVLHMMLINRNRIGYNKAFKKSLLLFFFWSLVVIVKFSSFATNELSYYLFLPYILFIAYIHCQVFGKHLLTVYESIMVLVCKIAFVLWFLGNFVPGISSVLNSFEDTGYGHNVLYLFNWMDPEKGQVSMGLTRNAGLAWEPGRFAVMIIPAIISNMYRNGIRFRCNKNIFWLLLAMGSTMSTTGYSITILIYSLFWLKKDIKYISIFLFVGVPIITYLISLDFMGEKIENNLLNFDEGIENRLISLDWFEKQGNEGYMGSWGRFESAYFEATLNIPHDPILGYGLVPQNSWYSKVVSHSLIVTGGLLSVISKFGIFLGIYLYYLLFLSSKSFGTIAKKQKKWVLFIAILMSSFSYSIFTVPVFTSIWLYGIYKPYRDICSRFIFGKDE